MAEFSIKRFDRLPSIQATLNIGSTALNLTGASVSFIMRDITGGDAKVNSAATLVTAASGIVRYDWVTADTDTAGNYYGEWEIHWADGKTQTVPTKGYHTIEVVEDLDGAL